jgi:hypothetical protein
MRFYRLHALGSLLLLSFTLTANIEARTGALKLRGQGTRDHLTAEEADRVRDAQSLDKRTEVFIKAAERRMQALFDPQAATSKQAQKDVEKYGAFPTGTRAELLSDLAKIFDEAITNVDDVNARNANNPLIAKSLHRLAEVSKTFIAQLTPLRDQNLSDAEREPLEQAIENMQSILEAADKLPPATKK